MALVNNIISFLVAIIILVGIHEFGHFYVARLCGVRVLRFSFGFGKVLWRRYDKLGTEYTLSALPFGGYVKMLDEREGEVPAELIEQAYTRKTVWQRMAIVLAGPVANFILAIFLFWMLLLGGEKGVVPVIGAVKADSIAAKAGLEAGQEILAVDDENTPTEQILERQLVNRLGETGSITFKVRYANSPLTYEMTAHLESWMRGVKDPDPLEGLGLTVPHIAPVVGQVLANTPAEKAGIKAGDTILQVNGQTVFDWSEFQQSIQLNVGKTVSLLLSRQVDANNIEQISLQVTPESFTKNGVSYGRIGIGNAPLPGDMVRDVQYSVAGALVASLKRTWDTSGLVFLSVKKLILGEISTKNLSGPISIAKVAGSSAQNGIKTFIGFVASFSVLLGVFNLLPIPVLDGGHLVYLYLEVIRGKPISERIQMLGFQVGLFVVVSLSILAMYNDIMRL